MKLVSIIANNGETLKGAMNNENVSYVFDLIEKYADETVKVLLYVTEVTKKQLSKLDSHLDGRKSEKDSMFANEDSFIGVYSNDKDIDLKIHEYPYHLQNEHKRFFYSNDGTKFVTFNSTHVLGTFNHFNPYAGEHPIWKILKNGNGFREKQFEYARNMLDTYKLEDIKSDIPYYDRSSKFEMHGGYWNMFGSVAKNLGLRMGDCGTIQQDKFLKKMRSRGLFVPEHPEGPTYSTILKDRLPITFAGKHVLVSDNAYEYTKVETEAPPAGGDRSAIVTTIEFEGNE